MVDPDQQPTNQRWFRINRAIGIVLTIYVFASVALHVWRWWTGTPEPP